MKLIYLLLVATMLCGVTTASINPYSISVIVWDENGNMEPGVAVTFAYNTEEYVLYSADDGSVSFSTLNFDDVRDGANITVSSKYGAKDVPVQYSLGAVGVTFNEPSEDAAVAAFAALGFIATAIGGGIYYLKRKKKGDN